MRMGILCGTNDDAASYRAMAGVPTYAVPNGVRVRARSNRVRGMFAALLRSAGWTSRSSSLF